MTKPPSMDIVSNAELEEWSTHSVDKQAYINRTREELSNNMNQQISKLNTEIMFILNSGITSAFSATTLCIMGLLAIKTKLSSPFLIAGLSSLYVSRKAFNNYDTLSEERSKVNSLLKEIKSAKSVTEIENIENAYSKHEVDVLNYKSNYFPFYRLTMQLHYRGNEAILRQNRLYQQT